MVKYIEINVTNVNHTVGELCITCAMEKNITKTIYEYLNCVCNEWHGNDYDSDMYHVAVESIENDNDTLYVDICIMD